MKAAVLKNYVFLVAQSGIESPDIDFLCAHFLKPRRVSVALSSTAELHNSDFNCNNLFVSIAWRIESTFHQATDSTIYHAV